MLKKFGLTIMTLILSFSMVTPGIAKASSNEKEIVSEKEIKNTEILVNAINELNQELDMENLDLNSQKKINQLSVQAKKLYKSIVDYKNQASSSLTDEDMLIILNKNFNELNGYQDQYDENNIQPRAVINYKEYKISNAKIEQLSKAAGVNGGFWATATAIAKIFAKSPTALTLMLGAVPFLGVSALNACNSKNKGVIITKLGSGATNSYMCQSQ